MSSTVVLPAPFGPRIDAFLSEADLRDHAAAPFASTLREKTESWFAMPPEVTVATVLGTKIPA
jgi:hypothetical protein